MEDNVPDLLEFETLKVHESADKLENILKLEDPPEVEGNSSMIFEPHQLNKREEEITGESPSDELLDLNEPPKEEAVGILDSSGNVLTEAVICQFAQNLVDPIVKEAIEIQKAEMEDSLSDEAKVDSSGDKKSEKSLSDDGFEYVKADDIHSPTNLDQTNEAMQHDLYSESYNKDNEDDSFLNDDLKIEDNDDVYENDDDIKHDDDSFLNEDLDITSHSSDVVYSPQYAGEPFDNLTNVSESVTPSAINFESKEPFDDAVNIDESFIPQAIDFESERHINDDINIRQPIELSTMNYESDKADDELKEEEDYDFDVQGIINASNLSPLNSEPLESIDDVLKYTSRSNLSQKCKDVFCWKDPIMSSIVLSAIMLIELGLMCDYSIISLLAYSGLLLLCSSFFYKFAVKFNLLKKCGQSDCTISVSSEDIQTCVDCVMKWIEYLFNEFRSLTYVTSFTKNLKAFTFFWILTYIGQWFNLLSLIFIGTIISFSLPIVYITHGKEIDQVVNNVRERVKESIDKLKLKSQRLINCRAC